MFKRTPLVSSKIDLKRIQQIQLPIDINAKWYISIEVILNVDDIPMIKTKRYEFAHPETLIITEMFYFDEETYEPYLDWTCTEKAYPNP